MSRGLRSHQGRKVRRRRREGLASKELGKLIETIKNDPNMVTIVTGDNKVVTRPKNATEPAGQDDVKMSGDVSYFNQQPGNAHEWQNRRKLKRKRIRASARLKRM